MNNQVPLFLKAVLILTKNWLISIAPTVGIILAIAVIFAGIVALSSAFPLVGYVSNTAIVLFLCVVFGFCVLHWVWEKTKRVAKSVKAKMAEIQDQKGSPQ